MSYVPSLRGYGGLQVGKGCSEAELSFTTERLLCQHLYLLFHPSSRHRFSGTIAMFPMRWQ